MQITIDYIRSLPPLSPGGRAHDCEGLSPKQSGEGAYGDARPNLTARTPTALLHPSGLQSPAPPLKGELLQVAHAYPLPKLH